MTLRPFHPATTINITAILPERTDGTADPAFCECDDDVTRLVKWDRKQEPFHGIAACFNELVCSRLAQLAGAPVLRGAVVFVSERVAATDPRRASPGYHFGIVRMQGRTIADLASNPVADVRPYLGAPPNAAIAATAAFLAWLRVGDHFFLRDAGPDEDNAKCVFLQDGAAGSPPTYRPIDFDGAFGTGHWPEPGYSLPPVDENQLLPPYMRALDPGLIKAELERLGRVAEPDIRACFTEIPEGWCTRQNCDAAATWAVNRANALGSRGRFHQGSIVLDLP